jgi:hypothetical protein
MAEEVVMTVLAVNHGAKGITMWDFPTTQELVYVTERLARVMTGEVVGGYLLGAKRVGDLMVIGPDRVDAAAWVKDCDEDGAEKGVLVSVVNLNYGNIKGSVEVVLPDGFKASGTPKVLWGDAQWSARNGALSVSGLLGLEVSILLVSVE